MPKKVTRRSKVKTSSKVGGWGGYNRSIFKKKWADTRPYSFYNAGPAAALKAYMSSFKTYAPRPPPSRPHGHRNSLAITRLSGIHHRLSDLKNTTKRSTLTPSQVQAAILATMANPDVR